MEGSIARHTVSKPVLLVLLTLLLAAPARAVDFADVEALVAAKPAEGTPVVVTKGVIATTPKSTEALHTFEVGGASRVTVHTPARRWQKTLFGGRWASVAAPEVAVGDTAVLTGKISYDAATSRVLLVLSDDGLRLTSTTVAPRLTAAMAQGDMIAIAVAGDLLLTPAERSGLRVVFQPGGFKVPAVVTGRTIVAPCPALFTAGQVLVEIPGRGRSNAVLYARASTGLTGSLR